MYQFALIQIPRLSCRSRHETKLKFLIFLCKKEKGSQPSMSVCLPRAPTGTAAVGRRAWGPPPNRLSLHSCVQPTRLFWLKIRPKWGSFSDSPAQTTVPDSSAHSCGPDPGASTGLAENLETGDSAKPKPKLDNTTLRAGGQGQWRGEAHLQMEGRPQRLSEGRQGPRGGTGGSGWSDVRKMVLRAGRDGPSPVTLKSGCKGGVPLLKWN